MKNIRCKEHKRVEEEEKQTRLLWPGQLPRILNSDEDVRIINSG